MPRYRVKLTRTSKFEGTIEVEAPDRDAAEARVDEITGAAVHQRLSMAHQPQFVWLGPVDYGVIEWDEAPDDECGTEWASGLEEVE